MPLKLRELFIRLLKSNSTTPEVADGLAIGVFIAFLPIIGIQMYVSLVLTRLFKKNSIVAIMAAWITNPFTAAPVYLFNLWVGNFIHKDSTELKEVYQMMKTLDLGDILAAGKDILIPLWIGSIIVGLVAAFISQRLCLRYYDRIKKKLYYLTHLKERSSFRS
ncbi:MAG: DUF2062 domain-containing protein [Deltaproteobacteria bacterium]|nr:DUF2062 domain-containing protein [Deltaproteobacteria bacterium]